MSRARGHRLTAARAPGAYADRVDEARSTTEQQGVAPRRAVTAPRWVVPGAMAVAVLVRLPLVAAPASADEAGFLVIARGWSAAGASLYGDYWVDRPPLLLLLFRAAELVGGLVPLRLLGALAVAVTVLTAARAARLLCERDGSTDGTPAAAWTAVLTAALLSSPLLQTHEVNGELLAAPFVATGFLAMAAALTALRCGSSRRAATLAAASGAAGAAALLVKQNIADVLVLDAVLLAALVAAGSLPLHRAARTGAWVAAGAVGTTTLVLLVAWARGASPLALLEAGYWFRLEALGVIVRDEEGTAGRALALVLTGALSGLAPALVLLLARTARRPSPVLLALAAVALLDLVSVALGGSFWRHYLIQPAVPLALSLGLLAAARPQQHEPPRRPRLLPRGLSRSTLPPAAPLVAAAVVLSAAVTLVLAAPRLATEPETPASRLGEAVRQVAAPGDTLTTLHGRPVINQAAGLPSPYPYLWSLPARVRDPDGIELEALLRSDRRATWLVLGPETPAWGRSVDLGALVHQYYLPVAVRDGLTLYLRRDAARSGPWSRVTSG